MLSAAPIQTRLHGPKTQTLQPTLIWGNKYIAVKGTQRGQIRWGSHHPRIDWVTGLEPRLGLKGEETLGFGKLTRSGCKGPPDPIREPGLRKNGRVKGRGKAIGFEGIDFGARKVDRKTTGWGRNVLGLWQLTRN